MRILIVGESHEEYLAKCHEAFRTGLRRTFDARPFGKGYPGFNPDLHSYREIIGHVFPEQTPDLIITEYDASPPDFKAPYPDLKDVTIPKAVYLGDYWGVTDGHMGEFQDFIARNGISIVLSYFPQPLHLFPQELAAKTVWVPACVDPAIFNDWQADKAFDVGFLAAGTAEFAPFYPERYAIHNLLLKQSHLSYLWAQHPGWQHHAAGHPLVGAGFSRKINSCRIFVTTGGRYHNLHAKYFEILASRSALFADFAEGEGEMQFRDGDNYVRIDAGNVLEKIEYFLARPDQLERISEAGHLMAMKRHSCYARALDFRAAVLPLLSFRPGTGKVPVTNRVKLHLEEGGEYWAGYVNVSMHPSGKAELRTEPGQLHKHMEPGTVSEAALIRTLNSLSLAQARDFFRNLLTMMVPGGKLIIVSPDAARSADRIRATLGSDLQGYLEGIRALHGFDIGDPGEKWTSRPHAFNWTARHLQLELAQAGFTEIRESPAQTPSNWSDMRVEARKPD